MKIVWICAQPGSGLKRVETSIQHFLGISSSEYIFCHLDDLLYESITTVHNSGEIASRKEAYRLPEPTIYEAADECLKKLKALLDNSSGSKAMFIFMHAAYANPEKRTHFFPFVPSKLVEATAGHPAHVVSLQQDIYEVRNNLWNKYIARESRDWRNPAKDFEELRDLLYWRQLDFYLAKTLSRSLNCPFHLLHAKTPVDTYCKIVIEGQPSVYLSHSISDSRRNWTKSKSDATPAPDPAQGDSFATEVNEFAKSLAKHFPVLEPTLVDELRLGRIGADFTVEQLSDSLLPNLSKRWPLSETPRLIPPLELQTTECGRYKVAEISFKTKMANPRPKVEIDGELHEISDDHIRSSLDFAQSQLFRELNQQITIRDYQLTDQSDVVVVYRPYQNPFVPRVSRGVVQEFKAKKKMAESHTSKRSTIVLVHPRADEIQRRTLIMTGWLKADGSLQHGEFQRRWPKHFEGDCPPQLKQKLTKIIAESGYPQLDSTLYKVIFDILVKAHEANEIAVIIEEEGGGLAGESHIEKGIREFLEGFIPEVLETDVILKRNDINGKLVILYDGTEVTEDLVKIIM